MKKKLLIFHPTIAPYRIDFFNDLYRAFDARICLRYRNLVSQIFDYEKLTSQFLFTPKYLKTLFRFNGRILSGGYWRELNDFKPDIVFVEEFSIGALWVLLHRFFTRRKYKVVSICDDSYNMVAENNDFTALHKLARKLLAPRLDEILVVEPKTKEWYSSKYNKGFWFPIIKQEEKARSQYAKVLQLSNRLVRERGFEGKCVFLFVGRLVALKNVDMVIRAFSKLDQSKNVLVIVGDGVERESLNILAKRLLANVIFEGRLEGDDLNAWYNVANCFVLASYQEAFGAVTNEALLAGCQCLISNKAGSACLIKKGGNGYTFDPMDENRLSELMNIIASQGAVNYPITLKKDKMVCRYGERMEALITRLESL